MESAQNPEIDLARQEKAKEYARIRRRLFVVNLTWNGLYALAWLVFGWAAGLRDFLLSFTDNVWLLVPAFIAIYGGISSLLTSPLSYYSGFVLPHRYELSNQTLREWLWDGVKGLLISAPLGLIIIEIIYWVLRSFPDTWWLWAAGIMLLFSVILSNLYPILIAPIFNKYVPLDEEHADLAERLLALAKQANTKVRGVYKFDMSHQTKAANAALTGIGNSRRIILGDTLIDEFETEEVEGILAHELGHHVNKDIPVGMAISSLITLIGLYLASVGLRWGVDLLGFQGVADVAAFPLFGVILGLYSLVTMPLSNAYSRWRERRADAYALEATQNPEAYAAAMTRLANQNLADVDPEPWVEFMLHSHPALSKRIQMAEEFQA
ncbi:MAG: M48 family peptidase [Chloroflexi bacterium]|nr:MAG: M48 family peptidase [Chloroflexota bacterium]MBL1196968.1 M48 family peptidase [Chloroflexota bacterium]NOH14264.1 M48 family metallopeptidase [Chloroflexota bacterium]